ncbi:MAG: hypothetical protein NTW86_13355 [Candidatus Sumerlaeota bacterium]|nr:hypothetical protein [Candidatus Sumerlaeota bacterium]
MRPLHRPLRATDRGTRRPAVLAYNTLIWQLEDARFERTLTMPSADQHGVKFRRTDAVVTVLWDWKGASDVKVKGLDEGAKLSDIWGNPAALRPRDGGAALQLSQSPVYLETRGPVSIE